ncbi:PREDICTED: uncharacterized protein LOC106114292 [Papilio xuthus]|uniref:Uncharacterized protein LOC106114292 n=1 Tax=Papilio xuthus TaxID=66420 RepID=A0AAJ7E4X8_PAPXU|nr:PREDICTED: uncharacterized protein LOC106114292 [Papilio xuthus]
MATIRKISFYCYLCEFLLTLHRGTTITLIGCTDYKRYVLKCYPFFNIKEIKNIYRNERTSDIKQYVRRLDNNVLSKYFISDDDLYKKYLNRFLNNNKEQNEDMSGDFPSINSSTTPPPTSQKGYFHDFIVSLCKIIINDLPPSRNRKLLSILKVNLRHPRYEIPFRRALRIFSKTIDRMTILKSVALKQKVREFLSFFRNKKPRKRDFLVLLNSIFNVYDSNKMDEYLYSLKKYAVRKISSIRRKTEIVIQKVIIHGIHKQPKSVKKEINAKFRLALIEYLEEHKT